MVVPYVFLLAAVIVLVRIREPYFAGLWWLAPAAAGLYLLLLMATAMSLGRRRRAFARQDIAHLGLERLLRRSLKISPAARGFALRRLFPRLGEMRDVAGAFSPGDRLVLLSSLRELGARTAVEAKLAGTRRKWERADALFSLGWLGDERSIGVLRRAMLSDEEDLAYVAGQSLARFESPAACVCLVEALRLGPLPRPLVATLLEHSRCPAAGELIGGLAGDRDADVRGWVAFLLGRRGSAGVPRSLLHLAADQDARVRASSAEALGAFADTESLEPLLHDPAWRVRANAAKAVGRAGLGQLAPELIPLLRDRQWWVRQSSALALKQLGPAAADHVRELLDDDDRFARNKAAEVLVDVGYVAQQIDALGGPAAMRESAERTLRAVARAEVRSPIRAAASSSDGLIRKRLLDLLAEVGERDEDREEAQQQQLPADQRTSRRAA